MENWKKQPRTFWIGCTSILNDNLLEYLQYTGNDDFVQSIQAARDNGLSDGEIICSFYAKLCYKSLTLGQNANVTRIRDIRDNLKGCFDAGHGSVFGHSALNFVTTDCSRILTHELVRNHIGTEYSQTSGRYVRLDGLSIVWDPILDGCEDLAEQLLHQIEQTVYAMECRKGLRKRNPDDPDGRWIPNNDFNFDVKKKLTSAIRRLAPNGQTNEIGWSINLRAPRHVIQMRTSRHAEWEIRLVFNQVYQLIKDQYPMIFYGAVEKEYDGLSEISGMKTQPYAPMPGDPVFLDFYTRKDLQEAIDRRRLS